MTTTHEGDHRLKLTVLDIEDLDVVSTLLHDGEARIADMAYLPAEGRFALLVARFDWSAAVSGRFERCRAGLHFERVQRVARTPLPTTAPETTMQLLAITFTPREAPAGTVLLSFVEGAQIRLEVECLEAEMRDIGPRWSVDGTPPAGETPNPQTAS